MIARRLGRLAGLILLFAGAAPALHGAVFIVRHAEKASESNEKDVPLSNDGKARARRIAAILKDAEIAAIYSTDTVRTLETARPLAEAIGRQPVLYVAATGPDGKMDLRALARQIRAEHAGGNVLVVGHSNTIGPLVHALDCAEDVAVAGSEYDGLWIVVSPTGHGGSAVLLRLRQ